MEFRGCWDRLDRAKRHAEALAEAWNAYAKSHPYDATVDTDRNGTGRVRVVQVRPAPRDLALELGELLYQLRAALDGAVYAAAILETGRNPPPDHEELAFPICANERSFKHSRGQIGPLTKQRRRIVEDVQPYNAVANLAPERLIFSPHRALRMLHDWARADRHRTLHVVGSWISNVNPWLVVPPGVTVTEFYVANGGLLEHESEVARFRVEPPARVVDVEVNPNLAIDVALREAEPPAADNDTLSNRLHFMRVWTREVVGALERREVDGHQER